MQPIADRSRIGLDRRRQLWEAIERSCVPTVYVLGNHEGYADWVPADELRQQIEQELPAGVHLLERSTLELGG